MPVWTPTLHSYIHDQLMIFMPNLALQHSHMHSSTLSVLLLPNYFQQVTPYQKLASLSHPVQVGVRVLGHVVVEYNVDTFNVHASSKQISCHQHTLAEALEGLVLGQSKTERTKFELGSWQRQSLSQAGDW